MITVRPAHADELAEVGELTVRAYAEWLEPDDFYVRHLRDAATRAREAEVYVALLGQDLAGTVTFCPQESPWSEIAQPGEGEFRMLAVDPAAQGAGAGTALARLCEERARAHGATGMALSSLATMAAAHTVYGRLGYARDPERDWSPVPGVDLLAFAKRL